MGRWEVPYLPRWVVPAFIPLVPHWVLLKHFPSPHPLPHWTATDRRAPLPFCPCAFPHTHAFPPQPPPDILSLIPLHTHLTLDHGDGCVVVPAELLFWQFLPLSFTPYSHSSGIVGLCCVIWVRDGFGQDWLVGMEFPLPAIVVGIYLHTRHHLHNHPHTCCLPSPCSDFIFVYFAPPSHALFYAFPRVCCTPHTHTRFHYRHASASSSL